MAMIILEVPPGIVNVGHTMGNCFVNAHWLNPGVPYVQWSGGLFPPEAHAGTGLIADFHLSAYMFEHRGQE